MKHGYGFSLLELIIALLLMAILSAIAVPAFNGYFLQNKIVAEAHNLRADISFARSEAATNSTFITICASSDGVSCGATDNWSTGWIIFQDDGAGGAAGDFADMDKKQSERLLRVTQQLRRLKIAAFDAGGAGIQGILFGPRGFVAGMKRESQNTVSKKTTITVCEPGGNSSVARAVWMEVTGRSALSHDLDQNGVHDDGFGGDLTC